MGLDSPWLNVVYMYNVQVTDMFMCVASYVSFTKTPVTLSSVATATAWRS